MIFLGLENACPYCCVASRLHKYMRNFGAQEYPFWPTLNTLSNLPKPEIKG